MSELITYSTAKFYSNEEKAKADKYHSNYQFLINFDEEYVETNCGDSYYDYEILFDDIIKLADYIKSRRQNETTQ